MRLTQSRFNLVLALAGVLMLALFMAGPIAQPAGYHDFADQRALVGIQNAADVLSNAGFLLAGAAGLVLLLRQRGMNDPSRPAYTVFFLSLVLTAFGSSWYHLAPDNARLVWDRLPIALACAALLAAVVQESLADRGRPWLVLGCLCGFAVASVGWWMLSGDLRPYLLIQLAPLLLIPVLQWLAGAPPAQRRAFGVAIALYVLAKLFELGDAGVFEIAHVVSGHTLKHMAASLAALVLACARRNATLAVHNN